MNLIKRFAKALVSSKKAVATTAGVLFAVVVKPVVNHIGGGLEVTEEQVQYVVAMVAAYVVGQGIADHGKEAVKASQQGRQ